MQDAEIGELAVEFLEADNSNYKYEFSHIVRREKEVRVVVNWYSQSGGFMDGPIVLIFNECTKKIELPNF